MFLLIYLDTLSHMLIVDLRVPHKIFEGREDVLLSTQLIRVVWFWKFTVFFCHVDLYLTIRLAEN